jgi:hypothetical protein
VEYLLAQRGLIETQPTDSPPPALHWEALRVARDEQSAEGIGLDDLRRFPFARGHEEVCRVCQTARAYSYARRNAIEDSYSLRARLAQYAYPASE